jgi:hypothetical protein
MNLVGYCEDEKPFIRMMVFEYVSNGSLFERLHGEFNCWVIFIYFDVYIMGYFELQNPCYPLLTFSVFIPGLMVLAVVDRIILILAVLLITVKILLLQLKKRST